MNIGCGHRFHPPWVNVDIVPPHPAIRYCDASAGLPFHDGEFDAVYHSHLLAGRDAPRRNP
jgi:predicted SAM-dependent methyltransferase